jgi:hypothetical protein
MEPRGREKTGGMGGCFFCGRFGAEQRTERARRQKGWEEREGGNARLARMVEESVHERKALADNDFGIGCPRSVRTRARTDLHATADFQNHKVLRGRELRSEIFLGRVLFVRARVRTG